MSNYGTIYGMYSNDYATIRYDIIIVWKNNEHVENYVE